MTAVLHVFYGHADGYVGIKITTTCTDDDVEVLVTDVLSCSEDWGVYLNGVSVDHTDCKSIADELMESNIHNVKWNTQRQQLREHDTYYKHYACVDVVYTFQHVRKTFEIDAWCFHNGYYPHTVKTKWRGHEDFQEL
jgi:hypothetical protein